MADYENTATDKWIIRILSAAINKVLGKKASERIIGTIAATGITGKLASKLKSLLGDMKSGVFTDFLSWGAGEKVAAKTAGNKVPSWTKLWRDWNKAPTKKWEDMKTGEKVGKVASTVGKCIGLIGAVCTAAATIGKAIEYGKDDQNRADKSTWEWLWDTSIPGATVNMVASWFGHGRKNNTNEPNDDAAIAGKRDKEIIRLQQQQKTFNKNATMEEQGYDVEKYNKTAKENNLVQAPANPQAYNEWRKKVEFMGNRNNPGNSTNRNTPDWYWKGKASKLLASTLTWSTIKNYYSTHENVSVASFVVDLMVPVEVGTSATKVKLHHEVNSNIEVLYEALRQKDTGAYQFTEEDVYWYLISMCASIAKLRYLHKCIAIVNTKSFEIQDLPKHMFAAMFGQTNWKRIYDDVVAHKADYAARLNDLAKEINSKALLDCSLISRWNYLADKCFADYSGPKSIKGTYIIGLCPMNIANGDLSNAVFCTVAGSTDTFATYVDALEQSWNNFVAKLSTGTPQTGLAARVSASMIKLLGAKEKTFGNVPYITGTETIKYDYDSEVFDQLRNARFCPLRQSLSAIPLYNGASSNAPYWNVTTGGTATSIDMGTYDDNDRLIATERNKEFSGKENIQMIQFSNIVHTDPIASGAVKMYLNECGTSLLDSMRIVTYSAGNAPAVKVVLGMLDQSQYLTFAGDTTQINFDADFLTKLSQIDYCPRIAVVRSDLGGTKNIGPVATYFDVDNFAYMTEQQYKDLNRVAVYSQFFFFNPEDLKVNGIVEA